MEPKRIVCGTCGGSGEIGYFQGESRFLLTREECPACCGIGYSLEQDAAADAALFAVGSSDAPNPESAQLQSQPAAEQTKNDCMARCARSNVL